MQSVDLRESKGLAIAQLDGQIVRLNQNTYRVKSQSGQGEYEVLVTGVGLVCSCPDSTFRGVKCKHQWAVEFSQKLRNEVVRHIVMHQLDTRTCPVCHSDRIIKKSIRHNKHGDLQRYLCKNCGKRFSFNLGFEGMKAPPQVITSAMQLYFTGESLRNVQRFLRLQGANVSHVSVYRWIKKYVSLMQKYLEQVKPKVSDTWRADEMWMKIKGNPKYLYALMDDETRFWIAKEVAGDKFAAEASDYASRLFQQGKEIAGKKPLTLITDGLHAYHQAYNREFYSHRKPQTKHVRHVTWKKGIEDNRKMERFNGEIRDREKVMRSLKREDTPILTGYQIFHNYVRPHEGLNGRTPAQACGIEVRGKNKWLTLIQNASRGPTGNRQTQSPQK